MQWMDGHPTNEANSLGSPEHHPYLIIVPLEERPFMRND